MKTSVRQHAPESKTVQGKNRASHQATVGEILQQYKKQVLQAQGLEEEEFLQGESSTVQREEIPNRTGLPNPLKSGVESLSGYSMDDVQVHYNSSKPAQLQALAYTQGTDIHVAPGQEQHLPHEAWHVVQQMQGRVQPTMQLQGVNVNDNESLEREADVMGGKAVQQKTVRSFVDNRKSVNQVLVKTIQNKKNSLREVIQCFTKKQVEERAYAISQRPERRGISNEDNWYQAEKEIIAEEIYTSRQIEGKGDERLQNWDDAVKINTFRGKQYEKKYNSVGFGCFNSKYIPFANTLDINLPVYFNKKNENGAPCDFPNDKALYYINNVEKTWSGKHKINFTGKGHDENRNNLFKSYVKAGWKTALNPVEVDVKAEKTNNQADACFKIGYNTVNDDYVAKNHIVALSEQGYDETMVCDKNFWGRLRGNFPRFLNAFRKYNVLGHETGHMFGLDDEYEATRYEHQTDHYDLTEKAFGKKYADDHARQYNNKNKSSIMNEGREVGKHHYVTFWDSMVQAIQAQYPGAPHPDAPNDHQDWEIV